MKNIVIDYIVYQAPENLCAEIDQLNKQLNDRDISDEQYRSISELVLEKLAYIQQTCKTVITVDTIYNKAFFE